jgi:hypothetical protein
MGGAWMSPVDDRGNTRLLDVVPEDIARVFRCTLPAIRPTLDASRCGPIGWWGGASAHGIGDAMRSDRHWAGVESSLAHSRVASPGVSGLSRDDSGSNARRSNKGMKQTSPEHIGGSQLIPSVRPT